MSDAGIVISAERELGLLRKLSAIILSIESRSATGSDLPTREQILGELLEAITAATTADAATLFLEDEAQKDSFVIRATRGLNPASVGVTRIARGEGLAGTAIAEGKIISVPDGRLDPRFAPRPETGEDRFHGFLAAPVVRDRETIGILVLHYVAVHAATDDEVRVIAAVAEQIGFALASLRLNTELSARVREMIALDRVTHAFGTTLDPKQLLAQIMGQTLAILPARAVVMRIFDPVSDQLHVELAAGQIDRAHPSLAPIPRAESLAGHVFSTGNPGIVSDARNDERAKPYAGCTNVLAVPLIIHNQVIGTFELIDRRDAAQHVVSFQESDQRVLTILARTAAEAYRNAQLYADIEAVALTYKRANQELTIVGKISREILGSPSIDEIVYIVLTGVTSGYGLGYNRALILLISPMGNELQGVFGIGATVEEVNKVWSEAPEKFRRLEDYFVAADISSSLESAFNKLVQKIRVPLDDKQSVLVRVIEERRSFNIRSTTGLSGGDAHLVELIKTPAFAAVPIWTRDLVVGVLVVDNCFNMKPIHDSDLVLLQTIANQCGLALDGARMINELSSAMNKLESTTLKLIEAERLAAIGEIAAGVAHDIRNPLTAIGGFTRRLAKRLPPDDPARNYTLIVEKEVARLEKLACDVLELATKKQIDLKEVNLLDLVRLWCDTNEMTLMSRKIQLAIDQTPLVVFADQVLIGQAVTNILQNAADAIAAGGRISVRGYRDGEKGVLEISDNGGGMSEETLGHVFEPFFTTKTGGTGLGLALAWKAVRAHEGVIEVDSVEKRGTTMRIVVPVRPGGGPRP